MSSSIQLREVRDSDLPIFYEQQLDPIAVHMAAFTAKDPTDREAFTAHWTRIRADDSVTIRTILVDDRVAGSVLSYVESDLPEVSYWIGREYWGRGIATAALRLFLAEFDARPVYARVAKDNTGSTRVLEKCGFLIVDEARGFANARGEEIEELVMRLEAGAGEPRDRPAARAPG